MPSARILIVEDEPSLAMVLEDDLRREGYDTRTVTDGASAVDALTTERFDLALVDVMLPKQDGFEVCRAVRRAGVRTVLVMLTAKTQEAEKVLGLDCGADDYVTKPYSPRELRARIKAHLRREQKSDGEVHCFGDAELDTRRCELKRAGRVIELSALEYKLLATFVAHAGRVLTRAQLLDEVWGRGTHVTDRVVDNQVTNLRKKIEPEPDRPRYLVSLRGLGYRFDVEPLTEP
jgi:two-component system alkaline phosphatase synthesis response regulator PhoP